MVRQALPPLPLAGNAEPIKLFMDFDARALPAPGKRN
jgi:hypothetical protein